MSCSDSLKTSSSHPLSRIVTLILPTTSTCPSWTIDSVHSIELFKALNIYLIINVFLLYHLELLIRMSKSEQFSNIQLFMENLAKQDNELPTPHDVMVRNNNASVSFNSNQYLFGGLSLNCYNSIERFFKHHK